MVFTPLRALKGGFPTPYRAGLAGVCVFVSKTGPQAVRICSVKEKTNQWMRVNPLTPGCNSKRREGGTKRDG